MSIFPQYVTPPKNPQAYGVGWIGGRSPPPFMPDHPDGRTKVNGEIKPLKVKCFDVETGQMIGETMSAEDGTWQLDNVDPNRRYQVVFQNDTYTNDAGELYNSFVQDWINGVPYEPQEVSIAYMNSRYLRRWDLGQAIKVGLLNYPSGTFTTNKPGLNVTKQANELNGYFYTDEKPGQYLADVTFADETVKVPYEVVPQPTYFNSRLIANLHPYEDDAGLGGLVTRIHRESVYSQAQNPRPSGSAITPLRAVSPGTFLNRFGHLSPEVPYTFIGGSAIGDLTFNIGDSETISGQSIIADFWVNIGQLPPAGKKAAILILSKTPDDTTDSFKMIWVDSTGKLFVETHSQSKNSSNVYVVTGKDQSIYQVPDVTLDTNTWNHILWQVGNTSERWHQVFVNGVLKSNKRDLGFSQYPWWLPNNIETGSATNAIRGVSIMTIPNWRYPAAEAANFVNLEGYMAKIQIHSGHAPLHKNFNAERLKTEKISRIYSSYSILPLFGDKPLVDLNDHKRSVNVFPGCTLDPVEGAHFDGTPNGKIDMGLSWSRNSMMVEFQFMPELLWKKQTILQVNGGSITDGINQNGGFRFGLGSNNDPQLMFMQAYDGSGGSGFQDALYLRHSTMVQPNQWYHVAITYDCINYTLKLYIDGVLASTTAYTKWNPGNQGRERTTEITTFGSGGPIDSRFESDPNPFKGRIRAFRYVIGDMFYHGNFTPPTADQIVADQIPSQWAVK